MVEVDPPTHVRTTAPAPSPGVADAIGDDELLAGAIVLVVDDEPDNVRLLTQVLLRAGVGAVHSTCDPREAVRLVAEVHADLVLLDLHMPHLDGVQVMAELRTTVPVEEFLPVLVLTADVTPETRDRVLDAGAQDLLHKPFSVREVVLRVRNLLETRARYLVVQQRNTALVADLARASAEERRRTDEQACRRERIVRIIGERAFTTVLQPIADLATGDVVGAEALTRFVGPSPRTPDRWFREAADVGLGVELELAALEVALAHLARLPSTVSLSLNVSPATVVDERLVAVLADADARRLVLELTEHDQVADYEPLLASLHTLRGRGLRIAVDDTGAGYAGLGHLVRMRPEIIKLDIELTRGIDQDPLRHALGTALVSFARDVGATIVAEGIETAGELTTLRELGVPWGQGYLLARPAPGPVPLRLAGPELNDLLGAR